MLQIQIPQKSKFVRIDIPFFAFEVHPLSRNQMKIVTVGSFDMHLSFVPDSVVNYVIRKFSFSLFERMFAIGHRIEGTEWEKKIQQNKEFYDWVEERLIS